jgi:hypothetical protein
VRAPARKGIFCKAAPDWREVAYALSQFGGGDDNGRPKNIEKNCNTRKMYLADNTHHQLQKLSGSVSG